MGNLVRPPRAADEHTLSHFSECKARSREKTSCPSSVYCRHSHQSDNRACDAVGADDSIFRLAAKTSWLAISPVPKRESTNLFCTWAIVNRLV